MWWEAQIQPVPDVQKVVYLDQGWGGVQPTNPYRTNFYYLPQGAFLKSIRYDWMVHLERPWKQARFAEAQYMRAYGFIVDPAEVPLNPGKLPVGFAARYAARDNEMMLDLNCAVCHTGELQVVQNNQTVSVRIDGAGGHQDFTGSKAGQFAGDLAISMIATYINPWKFSRFSWNVLGENNSWVNWWRLRWVMGGVLWDMLQQARTEGKLGIHPHPDGFGRTDGLGGIMNAAFAINISDANYRVANAPVSYPFMWEIPWFDWVQYTTSVRQPMARNIGEAMGTGARYFLKDPYGAPHPEAQRFEASLKVANLLRIEDLLHTLRAPCWPEDVFGKIDHDKAVAGYKLFHGPKFHCVGCHGPKESPPLYTAAAAPLKLEERNSNVNPDSPTAAPETWQFSPEVRKDNGAHKAPYRLAHWIIEALPGEEIGTDVTSALNFFRYRVDLTPTGMTAEEVAHELGPYYETNYNRQVEYYANLAVMLDPDPEAVKLRVYQTTVETKVSLNQEKGSLDDKQRFLQMQRLNHAIKWCDIKLKSPAMYAGIPGLFDIYNGLPVLLNETPQQWEAEKALLTTWDFTPDQPHVCANFEHLVDEGLAGYVREQIGDINVKSVSGGKGLNYLITLVRKQAYHDLDVTTDEERRRYDGYGYVDTPQEAVQYHARPLAGIWATAPFLHNGSVPSLYEMFLPAYQRTKKFYLHGASFDPHRVGLIAGPEKGAFLFDTAVQGNFNGGHEFRAGYRSQDQLGGLTGMPKNGVIGPEMTDDERWAIIEYLKIRRDMYDPVCAEDQVVPELKSLVAQEK
jgi:mono/diheme cytochrome c family protein